MRKISKEIVKLSVEDFDMKSFNEDEFAIGNVCFLSTKPNTHKLPITEKMLKRDGKSILGKFLVAKYDKFAKDVTTHEKDEHIMGYFPQEQEIRFEKKGKFLLGFANVVISKIYASELCDLFEDEDTVKKTSVEMKVAEDKDGSMVGFNIVGCTVLGKVRGQKINGSCPDAEMSLVRFSEDASEFYTNHANNNISELQKFSEERRKTMSEKNYKLNKNELKETLWEDIDKADLSTKITSAKNKDTLIKSAYLSIEDDWETNPSEKLKYPVMELVNDTLYYNKYALTSVLEQVKEQGDADVVNKVEKLCKKFNLTNKEEEDNTKMSKEIEFAAVDISNIWDRLYRALKKEHPKNEWGSIYCIRGIYEEDGQKFGVIQKDDEDTLYRLNFSFTDEGVELDEEIVVVTMEFVDTDKVLKFAEPENVSEYNTFTDVKLEEEDDKDDSDGDDDKDGEDDKKNLSTEEDIKPEDYKKLSEIEAEKNKQLVKDIEEKDNIIMEQEAELSELREFKEARLSEVRKFEVDKTLSSVKEDVTTEEFESFEKEGLECEMSELEGWKNKVKSVAFERVKETNQKTTLWSMPINSKVQNLNKSKGLWD